MINVQIPCRWCTKKVIIQVTEEAWSEWDNGRTPKHVQEVFPLMSADHREMFISQTCPACWTQMSLAEEY